MYKNKEDVAFSVYMERERNTNSEQKTNDIFNIEEPQNRLQLEKEQSSVSTAFDYREEEITDCECIYG